MCISSPLCHVGGLKLGVVEVFVLLPDCVNCMRKYWAQDFNFLAYSGHRISYANSGEEKLRFK